MSERNPFVDRLRGLAVSAVLVGHSLRFGGFWVEVFPDWARNHFIEGAYHGVTVFFVISGYLITQKFIGSDGLLLVNAPRFYVQRLARILPPLLLLMLTTTTFATLFLNGDLTGSNLSKAVFAFAQLDFWGMKPLIPHTNSALDPLWSLSIEETFYVLLPVLCMVLATSRRLVAALFIFAAAGLLARYLYADLYSFKTTFDQLAIGGLAAVFAPSLSSKMPNYIKHAVGTFSLAALLAMWFAAPITTPLTQSVIAAFAAAHLISYHTASAPKTPSYMRPMQQFGYLSYEIYLSHMLIMSAMPALMLEWRIPGSAYNFLPFALQIGIIFATAWAVERYYSQPVNSAIRSKLLRGPRKDTKSIDAQSMLSSGLTDRLASSS